MIAAIQLVMGSVSWALSCSTLISSIPPMIRATAADKGTAPVTTSAVVGYANPFWDREEVLLSGSPYPWGRYLGGITPRHHLLPDAHNWGGSTGVSVSRPVDALDVPEGSRHTRPIEAHSVTRWSMSVMSSEADEILAVKSWLHLHRGSAISFFAAVPGADVTIAAQAGTSLTVPELRFYSDPSPFVGISLLVAGEWEAHLFAGTAAGSSVTLATAPSGPATVGRLITRARLMGDEVTLVNPAYETAVELKTLLRDMDLTRSSEDLERFSEENSRRAAAGEPILDQYQFFVSDRAENFTRFAKAILPKEVKDTKQINIEEY